jgi:hypothetical protein
VSSFLLRSYQNEQQCLQESAGDDARVRWRQTVLDVEMAPVQLQNRPALACCVPHHFVIGYALVRFAGFE